mgnify:CR=1 FL=1|jgi:hypothetical protein
MLSTSSINYGKKIFLTTILVRLFFLILVVLLSTYMEKGFIASHRDVDDWRYEEGGFYYSQNATSLIDSNTFTEAYGRMNDNTGYNLHRPFYSTPLWYWVVCIIMYMTKTYWTVRILNIIIAGISSVVIYNFTKKTYGEKVARLTSKLFALLPYPVLFSLFSYKDHLVLLFTFYLLDVSISLKYTRKIKLKTVLISIFAILGMMLTRSGLSVILLVLCFSIVFIKDISLKGIFNIKILFFLIIGLVLISIFYQDIIYKFNAYSSINLDTKEANNTISLVLITNIKDLYKLPLIYMFSIITPIGIGSFDNSWFSVVSNINFIMIPIAIGSLLYIFTKKKRDKIVFYSLLGYYLITIIMSTGIFRHYYSLLPITFITFADYIYRTNRVEKLMWVISSILGTILIFYYYFLISN